MFLYCKVVSTKLIEDLDGVYELCLEVFDLFCSGRKVPKNKIEELREVVAERSSRYGLFELFEAHRKIRNSNHSSLEGILGSFIVSRGGPIKSLNGPFAGAGAVFKSGDIEEINGMGACLGAVFEGVGLCNNIVIRGNFTFYYSFIKAENSFNNSIVLGLRGFNESVIAGKDLFNNSIIGGGYYFLNSVLYVTNSFNRSRNIGLGFMVNSSISASGSFNNSYFYGFKCFESSNICGRSSFNNSVAEGFYYMLGCRIKGNLLYNKTMVRSSFSFGNSIISCSSSDSFTGFVGDGDCLFIMAEAPKKIIDKVELRGTCYWVRYLRVY